MALRAPAARPLVATRARVMAPMRPALPVRPVSARASNVPDTAELGEKLTAWANDTSVVLKVGARGAGARARGRRDGGGLAAAAWPRNTHGPHRIALVDRSTHPSAASPPTPSLPPSAGRRYF